VTQVEGSAWLSRVQRLRELVVTRAIFESNFWEQFLGAIFGSNFWEQFLGTIFMDIFVVVVDFLISIVLFLMALHGRQFDPD